ncbi:hypothetical protein NEOLEDRAFT_1147322 [Neolentinus lepideus HHB14362 ss-1]|uniref:RRM domain-containing protein n=1 Tax=Neolentinus lepideus HHB14362 ss-1 TaxID=1314782 RepID=A0A165T7R8_9AGAM|nr:hypothetical protein NEOLEDRAFT_1147322 [Neolentinus lepideus HHB14362 ss-1]
MASLRRCASTSARNIPRKSDTPTNHVELRGLPTTALPYDIIRLLIRNLVADVQGVAIDYQEYRPSGRAFVKFRSPGIVPTAVKRVNSATISAMPLTATPAPWFEFSNRFRGQKGLEEAIERGILKGNGANAGLPSAALGVSVVVSGLPWKLEPDQVRAYFDGFEFSPKAVRTGVAKVMSGTRGHRRQYLLLLASPSEAHRFVRHVHMRYFDEETWGTKYILRAKVIY